MISRNISVPASSLALQPIVAYEPNCKPAVEYRRLAKELDDARIELLGLDEGSDEPAEPSEAAN